MSNRVRISRNVECQSFDTLTSAGRSQFAQTFRRLRGETNVGKGAAHSLNLHQPLCKLEELLIADRGWMPNFQPVIHNRAVGLVLVQ